MKKIAIISIVASVLMMAACTEDEVRKQDDPTNPLMGYKWTYTLEGLQDQTSKCWDIFSFYFDTETVGEYVKEFKDSHDHDVWRFPITYTIDTVDGVQNVTVKKPNENVRRGYDLFNMVLNETQDTLIWHHGGGGKYEYMYLHREKL